MKGSEKISIGKSGHLNIALAGNGFEMLERNEVSVDMKKLWKPRAFGILERLLIPAKCTHADMESPRSLRGLEFRVTMTTSSQSRHIKATFDKSDIPELDSDLYEVNEDLQSGSAVTENSKSGSDASSPLPNSSGYPVADEAIPSLGLPASNEVIQSARILASVASDDIIRRASDIACEQLQWVRVGKELLQMPYSEVHELFPDPVESHKDEELVEVVINKWKDSSKGKATVGDLKTAFCRLINMRQFDKTISKDENSLISDKDIQMACTLSCNWKRLDKILLEGKVQEMFRESKQSTLKKSDKVRLIIEKYKETHNGAVTISQLREAFSKIDKAREFDAILRDSTD
jgi:hypothetical protein